MERAAGGAAGGVVAGSDGRWDAPGQGGSGGAAAVQLRAQLLGVACEQDLCRPDR